jgi:predicted Zn-dependent protease
MMVMQMKALACLVMLLTFTASVANAVEYSGYDPQRILTVSDNTSGQKVYGLDMLYLDRMLGDLSQHAGRYPPSFDSTEQKQRAVQDLNALSGMLDLLLKDGKPNPQILFRSAIANRMAHNLDISGAAENAEQQFQALLQVEPDAPQVNYQYGIFLAETGRVERSISYLEKALALGLEEANYSLGMAYLGVGNKAEAIARLNVYLKNKPSDSAIQKIIQGIHAGTIEK